MPGAPRSSAERPEYDLVRVLAEAGTLDEAARRLLELIAEGFDWSVGTLWLVDEEAGLLRLREDWSRPDAELQEFVTLNRRLTFARGIGLAGRVWERGEPDWIADLDDERFPRAAPVKRAGLRSAAVLPVVGAGGVIGVMEFFGATARAPEARQLDLMRIVGRQMGQYVARVTAEEALAATEERSASIVAAALDCIVTMDHRGQVVDFNPAAEETFGIAREDAVGRELAELIIPPSLRSAHRRAVRRYLETEAATILGRRIELMGLRADGETFPVELTVARIGRASPPLFAGFMRDITDRRRAQDEVARLLEGEHEARLHAEQAERVTRRVAVALQRSLLPPHLPSIPGIELGAAYRAAGEGMTVGGDFYDVFDLGAGRWGIAIGDVRGKGADAASVTALVRYAIRAAAVREDSPAAVLRVVNDALLRTESGDELCTAIYARLDVARGRPCLTLAVGGHPPPLLRAADGGAVREIGRSGTLLGAVDEPRLHDDTLELEPGDALLLYTDGVIESRTPDGLFGIERLAAVLAQCGDVGGGGIPRCVVQAVVDPPDHDVRDDVALLAVRAVADA